MFDALAELAKQDPLINLRQDDTRHELFLSLYGEVQKEIVAQTLAGDYGLEIEFRPTTPVCIERPNGRGAPSGCSHARPDVGPPIPRHHRARGRAPLPMGAGVVFELDVGVTSIPIHVFDSVDVLPSAHATHRRGHAARGHPGRK